MRGERRVKGVEGSEVEGRRQRWQQYEEESASCRADGSRASREGTDSRRRGSIAPVKAESPMTRPPAS